MFPYRLTVTNNGLRMVIAGILAMAVHLGLSRVTFELKPTAMPVISLPHSVSILLKQARKDSLSVKQHTVPQDIQEAPAAFKKPPVSAGTSENRERQVKRAETPRRSAGKAENLIPTTQNRIAPAVNEAASVQSKSEVDADHADSAKGKTAQIPEKEGEEGLLPGTVQAASPRYQSNAPPQYPGLARKRRQEGTVILQVLVSSDGTVDDLKIEKSSGFTLLDRAAQTAVRKWLFHPAKRGHQEIAMWVRIPVTFKLRE